MTCMTSVWQCSVEGLSLTSFVAELVAYTVITAYNFNLGAFSPSATSASTAFSPKERPANPTAHAPAMADLSGPRHMHSWLPKSYEGKSLVQQVCSLECSQAR